MHFDLVKGCSERSNKKTINFAARQSISFFALLCPIKFKDNAKDLK
jgi:hypothetical protein